MVFLDGPEMLFRLAKTEGTFPNSASMELNDVALARVVTGEATNSLKAIPKSMTDSFSSNEVVLNLRLVLTLSLSATV